jgi:RNA polymerase sigma factor (sigma-70 family)
MLALTLTAAPVRRTALPALAGGSAARRTGAAPLDVVLRSSARQVEVDAELARALLSQHPQAAGLVRQRFASLVNGILQRALGADADVEDVEQEVFLGVFRDIRRLRHPEALRSFVLTITKRTLGRVLRRNRAQRGLWVADDEASADFVGEVGDPAAHHAYCHLCSLLQRLRERERQAFMLRFVAGMETEEVARALGVSVPTARRAFTRALSRVLTWGERHPFLGDYLAKVGELT